MHEQQQAVLNHDNLLENARFDRRGDKWNLGFGLSPVSAEKLLRREFPEVPHWVCWVADHDPAHKALQAFVGQGSNHQGKAGSWIWTRVSCSYGGAGFFMGNPKHARYAPGWTGMLRITGTGGEDFLLFSYMRFDMKLSAEFMVSTGDLKMLRRFADDILKHLRPRNNRNIVNVNVINSLQDFQLKVSEIEQVYLPDDLHNDIFSQVDGFFGNRAAYREMGIPFKRGFLFAGLPGTGKTMLIRNLIRHCHRKYRVGVSYLSITRGVDADDLRGLFRTATEKRPALIILEDVESLCHETKITRSELLAELDGINQNAGMLLIATANDPSRIDPALVHRPSRFDRVWTFTLPDEKLRARYITEQFKGLDDSLIPCLAAETADWTFAYIKELRITAGILAIKDGLKVAVSRHYVAALKLLRQQFDAGKKGHVNSGKRITRVGFDLTPEHDLEELVASADLLRSQNFADKTDR